MPADHKVSVGWQIVATFITGANFWAFYRIRKLRLYLLLIFVPSLVLAVVFVYYIYNINIADDLVAIDYNSDRSLAYAVVIGLSVGLQALAIYLVIIWSRQHNQNYDRTPASL